MEEEEEVNTFWHKCVECGITFQCVPPHVLHTFENHLSDEWEHICSPRCVDDYMKCEKTRSVASKCVDWQFDPVKGWYWVFLDGSELMRKILNLGDKAPKPIWEED